MQVRELEAIGEERELSNEEMQAVTGGAINVPLLTDISNIADNFLGSPLQFVDQEVQVTVDNSGEETSQLQTLGDLLTNVVS
ncbi:MAG: bacteriocin [Scytonema sp. RU_4_4]|nr:bacteriocin [Scytonema sp. RU_4_4]NJR73197.1 bacteriocin [Scytonema sp. CRU_2_7]